MKNKIYKVKVKLVYSIDMTHEQTSMEKAKKDVESLINNYISQGIDLTKIFTEPPRIIYRTKKYDK